MASKFKGIAGIVAVILKIEANLKIARVPVKCIPNLSYKISHISFKRCIANSYLPQKIPFQVSQTLFY